MKFKRPAYTTIPNEVIDQMAPDLNGGELRVLLYILRRTFGFHQDSARISFTQLCTGYVTQAGRQLDRGTGCSRSTVAAAVESLETRGIILVRRHTAGNGALLSNSYTVRVEDDNAPEGWVAGDEIPNVLASSEIELYPDLVVRKSNQTGTGIGLAYKEEKESLEIKSISYPVEIQKKSPERERERSCEICMGYGVLKGANGTPAIHGGTLAFVRAAVRVHHGVFCECGVGLAWKALLADAELPMVRKLATK